MYTKNTMINFFRMAAVELQKQWAELEPNTGFSFENFERNAKLIKNKVLIKLVRMNIKLCFRKFHNQDFKKLVLH